MSMNIADWHTTMRHKSGKRPSLRNWLLATVPVAAALAATPAAAQDVPPVRPTADENGVSRATGQLELTAPEISIGTPGAGGLSHIRYWQGTGWTHGFVAYVAPDYSTTNPQYLVVVGNTSRTFPAPTPQGVFTSLQGDGSTLTVDSSTFVLVDGPGNRITFDKGIVGGLIGIPSYQGALPYGVATEIVNTDGERINLKYKASTVILSYYYNSPIYKSVLRLQSATNTRGYQIKFDYASGEIDPANPTSPNFTLLTGATAINNGVDYCDPNADSCSGLTQTWPRVTYSKTTSGSTSSEIATDNLGRQTRYTTNLIGNADRVTAIKRSGSSIDDQTFSYDASGRISSVSNRSGTTSYTWSSAGTLMTMTRTNALGQQRVTTTDASMMQMVSDRDELNRTTTQALDTFGRVTRITAPEGNYAQISYDARGNVIQVRNVAKSGTGLSDIVTSAVFPASCTNPVTCNKPTSTTDAKGSVTDFTYDATHGGILSVTLPAAFGGSVRPQIRNSYSALQSYYKNSSGSIVASGSPIFLLTGSSACQTQASCAGLADEAKTTVSYGPQSAGTANNLLPVSVTRGSGDGVLAATSAFTYDVVGNRLTVDGPLAGAADTTRTRYDAARQVIGVVASDPDGIGPRKLLAQRFSYNADGQVTLAETGTVIGQSDSYWALFSSQEQVATTYDANARPVKQELKSGGTSYALTQVSYDVLGRATCTAQRMDPAQWLGQIDACTPQTGGPNGPDRITRNVYDAAGQVVQIQAGVGTASQTNEVTTTFNANGTTSTVKDGENNLTTYVYDGHDRLAQTRYPVAAKGANASSATDYEQLNYDANGNVTQRRLRDGQVIGYSYDALNRLTFKDLTGISVDQDVGFAYDLLGRLSGTTGEINGHNVTFAYDALGRTLSETSLYGGTKLSQYDLAGRRTRLTHADGFYVTYDYDVTGNVTAIRENGAASGIGVLASYAYDNLGRRTSLTRGNGTVTSYSYDPVSRLSSLTQDVAGTVQDVTINGFAYNPAFQITGRTRSNDVYAWGGAVNVNRAYTANGLNQYTSAGALALGYDGRGNLTSSGSIAYAYTSQNLLQHSSVAGGYLYYDGLMRLDYISANAVTGGATKFDHDAEHMIQERDGNGNILRRYVYGPGEDEPLVWYEGSGTADRRWLHADERGSIVAVTNASGTAIAINSYDEYGIPGASNLGRFQYTGQAWLPELGMYYYKARIYSATLGRFMQPDPIGYADGLNLYNYVGSDPINKTDPSGLFKFGDEIFVQAGSSGGGFGGFGGFIGFGGFGGFDGIFTGPVLDDDLSAGDEIIVTGMRPKPKKPAPPMGVIVVQSLMTQIMEMTKGGKNDPMCTAALAQKGDIAFEATTAVLIVGGGIIGTRGSFINLKTGTTGKFFSIGAGGGGDIGISESGGFVSNLRLLSGGGVSGNISAGPLTFSAIGSLGNGGITRAGKSLGVSFGLRAGLSGTSTGTKLFGCKVRG